MRCEGAIPRFGWIARFGNFYCQLRTPLSRRLDLALSCIPEPMVNRRSHLADVSGPASISDLLPALAARSRTRAIIGGTGPGVAGLLSASLRRDCLSCSEAAWKPGRMPARPH